MSTDIEKPATGAASADPNASATGEATSSGPMLVLKPRPTGWRRLARRLRLRRNRAVVTLIAFLLLWHFVAEFIVDKPIFLATPGATWGAFVDLAQDGTLWTDLRVSGNEFLRGFISGLVVGIALGMFLGTSRRGKDYIDPLINGMYATAVDRPRPAVHPVVRDRRAQDGGARLPPRRAAHRDQHRRRNSSHRSAVDRYGAVVRRHQASVVHDGPPADLDLVHRRRHPHGDRSRTRSVWWSASSSAPQEGVGYRILISSQYFDNPTLLACVLLFSLSGVLLVKIFERIERRIAPWKFLD